MSNSIGDQFSIKIEKFVFCLVVIPSIRQKKQSRKKKRIKVTITSPNIERKSTKPSLIIIVILRGSIRFEFQRTVWQSRPRIDHWDSLVIVDQSVRSNISHNLRGLCQRSSEFPACITLHKLSKRIVFGVKCEPELTFSGNSHAFN